ncbi:hypothetical protein [Halalkalibacter oceani]|uniref:hypothetical protein n=1 Tax=Halalkalibacter oceani TaxID=1653776 RepID=UPI0033930060
MDMETLQRAKVLESIIRTERLNIKNWEELFKSDEITLSSATKPQKMYLIGEKKDEVRDVILQHHKEFLADKEREFEEL